MKVHNINPEQIKVGDFEISAIALGEQGRGRLYTIVPCPKTFQYLEPGLSKTGRPRLNNGSATSDGWITRICTEGSYVRGGAGYVSVSPEFKDMVSVVARGVGAYGAAGRTGSWDDLIVSVPDESWLRVKPCRHDAYILYFGTEKVSTLSYPEAEALEFDLGDSSTTSKGTLIQL